MKGLILVFIFAVSSFGQMDGNPDNWCREGFFTRDSKDFTIGAVKASKGTRAYFYGDDPDKCPDAASCRLKTYIVSGDQIVVNRRRNGYACAWFAPAKGAATVGWIRESDLAFPEMLHDASVRTWLGEWTYGENGIEFTENKLPDNVNVTGSATWEGLGDNVHVGELDGRYEPKNGLIEYSDGDDQYDCKATMRLLGSFLIVADNFRCGGVNVTFSGCIAGRLRPESVSEVIADQIHINAAIDIPPGN